MPAQQSGGEHRPLASLAGAIWCTLALAACGGSTSPGSSTSIAGDRLTTTVSATRHALETYWSQHFSAVSSNAWAPPVGWVTYTDVAPPSGASCAPKSWSNNSFFCRLDDKIYLDLDWLRKLESEFAGGSDVAVVAIVAHEFGHHLQLLHQRHFNLPIGKELEADCYAGVFLDAVDAGKVSQRLAAGDVARALSTIRGIADTPFATDGWFNAASHGGPPDRAMAMATGFLTGDPTFCSGYEQTGPIVVRTVGSYRLRLPPASTTKEYSRGFKIVTSAQPELAIDVTNWSNLERTASASTALGALAPTYFKGSNVRYIGRVEDFRGVSFFSVANLRYEQQQGSETLHGVLVLISRGDGTGLMLDAYGSGPAPALDAGWDQLGNYVFSTLWGITE